MEETGRESRITLTSSPPGIPPMGPSQALSSPPPRARCTSTTSPHRAPSCRHACQGAGFQVHKSAHQLLPLLPPGLSRGPPRSQGRPQNVSGFPSHTPLNTVGKQSVKGDRGDMGKGGGQGQTHPGSRS